MTETPQHKSSTLSARIMKLMSMFSGLQMLSIVCSVVKMKLVALWLGTTGVGLFGIYQSVVDTTSTFTNMGILQSSVRDVASAKTPTKLAAVMCLVRRWSMYAAILGATALAAFAIPLGYWFFSSAQGCWGFIILALSMFLNAICNGEQAILQGTERLKALAQANLWGTVGGLILSIPLFYLCGYWSVPLSIVAYSIVLFAALKIKRVKSEIRAYPLPHRRGVPRFVRLGLYMASAAFVTSLAHTIFIGLLNSMASTSEVGLVQAGDTLVVRYIGLLFTAIGMEFYPRVAAHHRHPHRLQVFVNHEITLLMLCLLPLLCLFLLLRTPLVSLLYTKDFYPIIPFVSWAALSSIPKAVSWCMSFIIMAKGDGKIYIITETLDAAISVPLCLGAYSLFGLTGLGISYILWYVAYCLISGYVYYKRYNMRLNIRTYRLIVIVFAVIILFLFGLNNLPLWVMSLAVIPVCFPPLLALKKLILR